MPDDFSAGLLQRNLRRELAGFRYTTENARATLQRQCQPGRRILCIRKFSKERKGIMKKRTKIRRRRSLALFLALTMTMSMALTAFAEEAPAPSDSAGKTADDNININIIDVPQDPPVFDLSQTERPGQTEGITVQPGAPENSAPGESDPGAKPAAPAGTDAPAEPTAPAETEPSAEPTASAGTEPSAEPTAPTGTEPSAEPTAPAKTEPSAEPTASAGTEPPAEPAAPAETETGSDPGTADGNITKPVDPDWDVFYDAARDTYKLTYKIRENAEGDQTLPMQLSFWDNMPTRQ